MDRFYRTIQDMLDEIFLIFKELTFFEDDYKKFRQGIEISEITPRVYIIYYYRKCIGTFKLGSMSYVDVKKIQTKLFDEDVINRRLIGKY